MKFFVIYSTSRYEGKSGAEFPTVAEVLEFLNQNAENPDFTFEVIEGRRVEFEPAVAVKAYRKKS